MRVAIIGGGVSGLVTAYKLNPSCDVTVFEANDYPGGHTNTVDFELGHKNYSIDTGFIVFNDRTYPNFIELLDELQVASQPTIMSFSVACEETGLEYRGADFEGLFAQRRNLVNPRFYRLLYDLLKFNRESRKLLASEEGLDETVEKFIDRRRYSHSFVKQFLLPMGSAIWSCPFDKFLQFPIRFIAEFYENHGLLSVSDRPQWRVVKGGSQQYVKQLIKPFADQIQLNTPVNHVSRDRRVVTVYLANGEVNHFDHVVFACHADQALRILGTGATLQEIEILSAFPYEKNVATLHTQTSVLPESRRAWASWNYFNPVGDNAKATVTYNMNILQSIESEHVFNVTLNDDGRISEENIIRQFTYHHPTFDINQKRMQNRHLDLLGPNRTSFCGAYWGNGFHEDGVSSALAVVDALKTSEQQRQLV